MHRNQRHASAEATTAAAAAASCFEGKLYLFF